MDNTANGFFPCEVSIVVTSEKQLATVYAILGASAMGAVLGNQAQRSNVGPGANAGAPTPAPTGMAPETVAEPSPASGAAEASPNADDGEVDAGGHPWSAELHASTKGKTKDGFWRMKVGVSRPDPLPGFDSGGVSPATGTNQPAASPSATSQDATASGNGQPATSGDDEDEFAAFRTAAAASDDVDKAAAAAVPERAYSDADLGALCNQAAVKLGDPAPIKEIIGRFIPEGQVAHSRNIPADQRPAFVKEVEAKAGIEFAG